MLIPRELKLLGKLAGSSVVVATLALGLLVWRLSQGPVSLAFLSPHIADALAYTEAGLRADVDDTVLSWSETNRSLRIQVKGVRLTDRNGRRVVALPEMAMHLSFAAMTRGIIAPVSIDIVGIEARLLLETDGRISLDADLGGEATTEPDAPGEEDFILALLDELSKAPGQRGSLSYLEHISISKARINVDDRLTGAEWLLPSTDLNFVRGLGLVHAGVASSLEIDGQSVGIIMDADFIPSDRSARGSIRLNNFRPSALAKKSEKFATLAPLQLPFNGSAEFTLAPGPALSGVSLDLKAGQGQVVSPEQFSKPVDVVSMRLVASLGQDMRHVTVKELEADLGEGLVIELSGEIGLPDTGIGIDVSGGFRNLPVVRLVSIWPRDMAVNARDWFARNMDQGGFPQGRFRAKLTAEQLAGARLKPNDMVLDFNFDKLGTHYFRPLQPIRGGKGSARLDADRLEVNVQDGRIGDTAVEDGKVTITGLQDRDQFAVILVTLAGKTADVLTEIDKKPLGFPSRLDLKPSSVAGTSRTSSRFRFPLNNDLRLDDIEFSASSLLEGLAIPGLLEGKYDLANGRFTLNVDTKGLNAEGNGQVNQTPMHVRWRQEFDRRVNVQAKYQLSGVIDNAGRRAMGYPTEPWILGPTRAEVSIETDARSNARIDGSFDLKGAVVDLSEIHWKKPPEDAGLLTMRARVEPGKPVIFDRIELRAHEMSALARAQVNRDLSWSGEADRIAYGANRGRGSIKVAPGGAITVRAQASNIDLRPFIKSAMDTKDERVEGPPLDIEFKADIAQIDDAIFTADFSSKIDKGPYWVRRMNAGGNFIDGGRFDLAIAPVDSADREGRRQSLNLKSDNAGMMFAYFGVSDMLGGTFEANANIENEPKKSRLKGRASANEFRAVNTPFLARLLGIGSFTGLANLLSGEGIRFNRADIPFTSENGIVTLEASRFRGPQVNLSLEGIADRNNETLNISGTMVPDFILNTIFGNIPLIGPLIVGREGEGLIGVNFRISGPQNDAQVTVNPLSIVTPGFLRRIFPAPESDGAAQPAPAK